MAITRDLTFATIYTDAGLNLSDTITYTTLNDGTTSLTATVAELNTLDGITATVTELNYTDGVTSNLQTQLDAKLPLAGGTMTGNIVMAGAQTVDGRDLSADGTKLDGIESGATADQTASEILTALLTVDGTTSGLDADLLDGQHGSYYAPISGPSFTGNITLTGEIRGPSVLVIDPAVVSDNTGLVIIKGDLQIDGTTTTINSTTLEIDDKNIILAANSVNAAAADGAGITVDGASATLTYVNSGDKWQFNKAVDVTGTVTADGLTVDATNSTFNGAVGITSAAGSAISEGLLIDYSTNLARFLTYDSSTGSEIAMYTQPSGGSTTQRIRINSDGDISFYEDTGTTQKFFWDASDERLTLTNSDNYYHLGISNGTSQPWYLRTDSSGKYHTHLNGTGDVFTIDTSGNVGIGTTSPDTNLTVYGGETDTSINVNTGTGGSYPKYTGISFGATSTSLGGDLQFRGGAGIQAINHQASGNPTHLMFWNSYTGTPTERMRITDAGNVGIGTTSPQEKFVVSASASQNIEISGSWIQSFNRSSPGYASMGFYASSYAFNNGNVGIGTTGPAQMLELSKDTTSGGPFIQFRNRGTASTDNTNTYMIGGLIAAAYRDVANPSNIASITFERSPAVSGLSSAGAIVFGARFNGDSNLPTERMRIDSDGRVVKPYQVSFEAYRTLGNEATNNTVVVFNNTRHNVGNHYSTSTGQFTAPVDGTYLFTHAAFTNNAAACTVDLQVNGTSRVRMEADSNNAYRSLTGSGIFSLSANDVVRIFVVTAPVHYNTSGNYSNFCGYLLG